MVYFPNEIMRHIYEYDNTYHIIYKKVLKHLHKFFNYKQSYLHAMMIHSSFNENANFNYSIPISIANKL